MNISKSGYLYKVLSVFCYPHNMPKTTCQLATTLFWCTILLPCVVIFILGAGLYTMHDFNEWIGLPSFLAWFLAPQTLVVYVLGIWSFFAGLELLFEKINEAMERRALRKASKKVESVESPACALIQYTD